MRSSSVLSFDSRATMHYARRPSYVVASYHNQRLHPYTDPSLQPAAPSVVVPPPLYFPNAASRPTRVGHLRTSINTARSITTQIEWTSHPASIDPAVGWVRFLRVPTWIRVLRGDVEQLDDAWPREWSADGSPRRSGSTDHSGAGLESESSVVQHETHPLEELFVARIKILNEVIPKHLKRTRTIMVVLEVLDLAFLVVLCVALGVTRGQQVGFTEGVEIALILLILVNAGCFSRVRVRRSFRDQIGCTDELQLARWALSRELRALSRDWSPLPVTSSTNQGTSSLHRLSTRANGRTGLLNNFLGETDVEAEAERMAEMTSTKSSFRWSMIRYEGSVLMSWTAYRPIVKVELVTPNGGHGRSSHYRVPVPVVAEEPEPSDAPAYVA